MHGANTSLALSVNPACELCERMATLHLPLYHKIGEDVHAHGSCVCYTAPARSCWHSCSQRLFDGLGHFLENLLVDTVHNLAENEAADTCPPNAIFPEVLNSNTMYLEGVGGQADAILCHNRRDICTFKFKRVGNEGDIHDKVASCLLAEYANATDWLKRHYVCHHVPRLGVWFNVSGLLAARNTIWPATRATSQNEERANRRTFAVDRGWDKNATCSLVRFARNSSATSPVQLHRLRRAFAWEVAIKHLQASYYSDPVPRLAPGRTPQTAIVISTPLGHQTSARPSCGFRPGQTSLVIHLRIGDLLQKGPSVASGSRSTPGAAKASTWRPTLEQHRARVITNLRAAANGVQFALSLHRQLRQARRRDAQSRTDGATPTPAHPFQGRQLDVLLLVDVPIGHSVRELPDLMKRFNVDGKYNSRLQSQGETTAEGVPFDRIRIEDAEARSSDIALDVRLMSGTNPLHDLHCMASADILVPGNSFFSLFAARLNRGLKVLTWRAELTNAFSEFHMFSQVAAKMGQNWINATSTSFDDRNAAAAQALQMLEGRF